jgi:hypothetical protein
MFGIKNPEWNNPEQEPLFQLFILNRERYDKGELSGSWLTLPSDADTLRELFERIGVDRASGGAFSVTAVRMPLEDYLRGYVTKYDSIDELNMLASYMNDMQDYELEKLKAVLSSGVAYIGSAEVSSIINLLDEDNFNAVELIDAKNASELGEYRREEKPDEMSCLDYGVQAAKEENGKFTEWGYLCQKYGFKPKYNSTAATEKNKIVGPALQKKKKKTPARTNPDGKTSVIGQIREAQKTHGTPKEKNAPDKTTRKGDKEEL